MLLNIVLVDEDKGNRIALVLPENDEDGLPDLNSSSFISGHWNRTYYRGQLSLHDEMKDGKEHNFLKAICHWSMMKAEWEIFLELPKRWNQGQIIRVFEAPSDKSKNKWDFKVIEIQQVLSLKGEDNVREP